MSTLCSDTTSLCCCSPAGEAHFNSVWEKYNNGRVEKQVHVDVKQIILSYGKAGELWSKYCGWWVRDETQGLLETGKGHCNAGVWTKEKKTLRKNNVLNCAFVVWSAHDLLIYLNVHFSLLEETSPLSSIFSLSHTFLISLKHSSQVH